MNESDLQNIEPSSDTLERIAAANKSGARRFWQIVRLAKQAQACKEWDTARRYIQEAERIDRELNELAESF